MILAVGVDSDVLEWRSFLGPKDLPKGKEHVANFSTPPLKKKKLKKPANVSFCIPFNKLLWVSVTQRKYVLAKRSESSERKVK